MLSSGQVNAAFQQALGRNPTGSELAQYTNDSSFDGGAGQQALIAQLGGSANGNNSSDPAVALQNEIASNFQAQNTAYQNALSDYEKQNPFSFSQMLQQNYEKAAQNLGPMFQQQYNNFMRGINNLIANTKTDLGLTLTKLQADSDAYQGQAKAVLDTALTQVGQEYGNAGGYDSGARARAQGVQEANTAYDVAQNQRDTAYNVTNTQNQANRTLNQTIPLSEQEENQSIANTEAGDIYNQGQQLTEYGQQLANYNAQEYAVGQVPGEGTPGTPGYATPKTIPGMSSGQTQQFLQGLLPNVQVSSYGGQNPDVAAPTSAYG